MILETFLTIQEVSTAFAMPGLVCYAATKLGERAWKKAHEPFKPPELHNGDIPVYTMGSTEKHWISVPEYLKRCEQKTKIQPPAPGVAWASLYGINYRAETRADVYFKAVPNAPYFFGDKNFKYPTECFYKNPYARQREHRECVGFINYSNFKCEQCWKQPFHREENPQ